MRLAPLACLPLLAAAPALASSDAAWRDLHARVERKCIAASGLVTARASKPIGFDDTLGKTVMLVSGRYKQPRLARVPGRMLCVFDNRSGRTWISEAEGWQAPPR